MRLQNLYNFARQVCHFLGDILYYHKRIDWEVDDDTRQWLQTSGATEFLSAFRACRHLEVTYIEDVWGGRTRTKDEVYDALARMAALCDKVISAWRRLTALYKLDEPYEVEPQFAVRRTKNRFKI